MHLRVEFVLKDVQVVGGSNSNDVLSRVPGRVEDLLGEVQAVHADVIFPPLPSGCADPPGLQDSSGLAALPRCLQGHVAFGVAVKHAKEVVVCSGHNHTAQRRGQTSQQCYYSYTDPLNKCKYYFLYLQLEEYLEMMPFLIDSIMILIKTHFC